MNIFSHLPGTKKVEVSYSGGESRIGNYAVDYMLANVGDIELYAELPAQDDETATYDDLKADILKQANKAGIGDDMLVFYYDGE